MSLHNYEGILSILFILGIIVFMVWYSLNKKDDEIDEEKLEWHSEKTL
jgi:hypothetical protein